jgi:hypothetical protein
MSEALAHPEVGAARSRQFVQSFVRPGGLDRPVAPIMADEIERVAALAKQPRGAPLWHAPVRRALLAALKRRTSGAN